MAATFYTEPVLTFDLDVFILLQSESGGGLVSLDVMYQALRGRGYNAEREHDVQGSRRVDRIGRVVTRPSDREISVKRFRLKARRCGFCRRTMRSSKRRSHRRAKSITKVCPHGLCEQNI